MEVEVNDNSKHNLIACHIKSRDGQKDIPNEIWKDALFLNDKSDPRFPNEPDIIAKLGSENFDIESYVSKFDVIWFESCPYIMFLTNAFGLPPKANEMFWTQVHMMLKPGGFAIFNNIRPLLSNLSANLFDLLHQINDKFLYVSDQPGIHRLSIVRLRKIRTFNPEITPAFAIDNAVNSLQPLTQLFNLDPSKYVCELAISRRYKRKLLGRGKQGGVYEFEPWKVGVVVKELHLDQKVFLTDENFMLFADPIDGEYKLDSGALEVVSSALLDSIASGFDNNAFSLHLPRFTGFFACPDNPHGALRVLPKTNLYIIMEKLIGPLFSEMVKMNDKNYNLRELKILIWQILFTIIQLNKMGWTHQDASPRNVIVVNVSPQSRYRKEQIYNADIWSYELSNIRDANNDVSKVWDVPNIRKIAKLTDFGYAVHTSNTFLQRDIGFSDAILSEVDSGWSIKNAKRPAYDIVYFIMNIISYPLTLRHRGDFQPLGISLLQLANIDATYTDMIDIQYPNRLNKHMEKYWDVKFGRPKDSFLGFDPEPILDSPFFRGVIKRSK